MTSSTTQIRSNRILPTIHQKKFYLHPYLLKASLTLLVCGTISLIIIGPNSFSCKSTSLHLKIQTDTPDNYRNLIHFLKSINTQYHTYQLQSDKPLWIVIINIHPSTPDADIAIALEESGYSVKNVTNVQHQHTKTSFGFTQTINGVYVFLRKN